MGDFIKVDFESEILEGVIIKEDKNYLTLKLKSGYNANLDKTRIKILEKKSFKDLGVKVNKNKNNNSGLPKVTILHTGGTIASKIDYTTGAVSSKFTPEELLNLYPEFEEIVNIDAKMIGNMASDDMRFEHYNVMMKEIKLAIESGSIGVIISHGTDTMHYTSCALQYSLTELPVPVLLVGAQRSSDRASSDAFLNLKAAINFFIDNSKKELAYRRVGICMHENLSDDNFLILDGINAKKMHSSRRDAFKQINYLPYAKISKSKIEILRPDLCTILPKSKVSFTIFDSNLKIGFYKVHPHTFVQEIKSLLIYDAVIVEATGLGHIPISHNDDFTKNHPLILEEFKNLIKKGTKIIAGVQTVYGMVDRDVYSPGRIFDNIGVYGNFMNLTTESLFMRTAYILSKDSKHFDKLWKSNLEGFEIRNLDIDLVKF